MKIRAVLKSLLFSYALTGVSLLLLAFLLCAAAVGMRLHNGGGDQSDAEAIKSIRTEEKIFAMTVVVTGDEKTADLEALAALCGDFGVFPTYFVTPDWAEDHASLCAKLTAKGGQYGAGAVS